jgi:adenosylhomocysteine nucleosidase
MKIGIIGAMDAEVKNLINQMDESKRTSRANLTFYEGTLENQPVVVVKSGIGKVNAAMCAQILIDVFEVEGIINTGVAGALSPKLEVGDIVLASEVMQHDIDASIFGDPRGEIPGLKQSIFPTAPQFLDACNRRIDGSAIYCGRIITGDQAVGDSRLKEFLYSTFNGLCVEMEGGAIGQVCYLNDVKFMVIRAISDKANEKVDVDYGTFMSEAADKSCKIVRQMLKNL